MERIIAARERSLATGVLLAGALGIGTGIAVAAPADGEAQTSAATVAVSKKVGYGERMTVRGTVASKAAGRQITLEYAPTGGTWRQVANTTSGAGGRFAASLRPRESGKLRAVVDGSTTAPRPVAVVARLAGTTRSHIRRGGTAAVRGTVHPGLSGRTVLVQVSEAGRWNTVDRARTGRGGRFRASWRAQSAGRYRVRVVFRGDRRNAAAARRTRGRLNVYRPSHASWYGPGFYGNRTACGRTLGTGTLGVAHKTLPCGTLVTFRYRGRSVTVPVIDRGPYAAGRDWDLTGATKRKLGFGSTGTVWSTR